MFRVVFRGLIAPVDLLDFVNEGVSGGGSHTRYALGNEKGINKFRGELKKNLNI